MKRLTSLLIVFVFGIGLVLGSVTPVTKAPVQQSKLYQPQIEPATTVEKAANQPSSPIVIPNARNGMQITLVDSSKNGYGMIKASTRPLAVTNNGFFFVYRQWAGPDHNAGQIGGAFSEDAVAWTTYQNLNPGQMWNGSDREGRYPSALGNSDYPYAFWNEYTGQGTGYGGRPYYTYDEFGWDGASFANPVDVDMAWSGVKDLWVGSPDYSFGNGMHQFNVAYDDWTRADIFLFHSEAYEDGFIVFGSEIKVFDINSDFVGGTAEGRFNSSPVLDINDNGFGYVATSAYFLGADQGASPYANTHTIIFKKTEDYGATWTGNQAGSGYYFIPDNVFTHMLNSGTFPNSWTDDCPDENGNYQTETWDELFCAYEFDLRVDSQGNPHIIAGVLPTTDEFVWPGIVDENGFYHFWIDKNYLSNPGLVGTPMGWNYAFVASTKESWMWEDQDGSAYWQLTFPTFSISEETDNVMYVVSSMVVPGPFEVTDDGGTPDDPCDDIGNYNEWSEDVFVIKSEDGGQSWWCPLNATNTPDPDPNDDDSPEEICAQASPDGATADRVYLTYQMPDWLYGSTTGDQSGRDHRNRVYAGWVDLSSEPSCGDVCENTIDNQGGWNLVGLPVGVEDANYLTLFPDAIDGTLYSFGVGYEQETILAPGEGYWLRFTDIGSNVFSGNCINSLSITLSEGWNLISGGSSTINVNNIDDPNNIIIAGTFYGFGVGYEQTSIMNPGSGYWVRTSAAGDITLLPSRSTKPKSFINRMETANQISFNGNTLYFGVKVPDEEKLSYSLPPKPPAGAFDVRFSNDMKYIENAGDIEIMNDSELLIVTYDITDASEWVLINRMTGQSYNLMGYGEVRVAGNVEGFELTKNVAPANIPESFALHSGYPNPFNPETTIKYSVAEAQNVSIIVYDMLGREVKTLVSGFRTPNTYSVIWNGTDNNGKPVPSGVYFYRMIPVTSII